MSQSKFYIIAGEASGDLHAGNLMRAMLEINPDCNFRFWGGDEMKKHGGTCVKHIKELAFMGFVEVLMNIRTIAKNLKFCKEDILQYKPERLILVDYPGFNLRIAAWAHKQGIQVVYYISPQVWAWKQSRVHTIKKVVDEMYVILPFEQDFYKKFNFEVQYVGHPLLDAISNYQKKKVQQLDFHSQHQLDSRPIIAVLPGSRRQEISKKLPIMLQALTDFNSYNIVIAGSPNLDLEFYEPYMAKNNNIYLIHGQTYDILSQASIAVVTSGTATLETALFEVPQVVCYVGSSISYHIAKFLIKIKFISLVNLIMNREIVKELIQSECTPENIKHELTKISNNEVIKNEMLQNYQELKKILGGGGASQKVAQYLLKTNN